MTTTDRPEPTVDFETLFESEDLQGLLEAAEATSSIKSAELVELLEAHAFDPIEVEAIIRELEARGFEVSEDDREPTAALLAAPVETTTDALQLYFREAGRHRLLTAAQEVELAKAIKRGDEEAKRRMIQSNASGTTSRTSPAARSPADRRLDRREGVCAWSLTPPGSRGA